MPTFKDAAGRDWIVAFDGLLLKELRDNKKIDLADVMQATYLKLERDPSTLVDALSFVCGDQIKAAGITPRQFSTALVGKALDDSLAAVWGAAELFFQPKLWSALVSRCAQERAALDQYQKMQPMLLMFNQPEMPAELREQVWAMLGETMRTLGLQNSAPVESSASGQEIIPSTSVTS